MKTPTPMNVYANRDIEGLSSHYMLHLDAMTREGLHSKSDIAAELAWRDAALAAKAEQSAIYREALNWLTNRMEWLVSHDKTSLLEVGLELEKAHAALAGSDAGFTGEQQPQGREWDKAIRKAIEAVWSNLDGTSPELTKWALRDLLDAMNGKEPDFSQWSRPEVMEAISRVREVNREGGA